MNATISYRNIIRIAFPMLISGLAMNAVGIIDTIFVTRLGEAQLGGAGNGNMLYSTFFLVGMGLTVGVQILIARRNGEANYTDIGNLFYQGMFLAISAALVLALAIFFLSPEFISLLFESEKVTLYSVEYLQTRCWGLFFSFINLMFTAFFVGTTKTKILGIITPLIAIINILLDYCFIFGNFGFPELGVTGAAIASNLSEFIGTILFASYFLLSVDLARYNLNKLPIISKSTQQQILLLSGPLMLQKFVALGSWFSFFVIIEHFGERALASSQIIRSLYIFLMVPIFAFADATNTLVSNLIGEQKTLLVIPLIKRATIIGLLINGVYFIFLRLFPHFFIGLYSPDVSLQNFTVPILNIISISMFLFTAGVVVFRAVYATGNTKDAMVIEFMCIGLYILGAVWIAQHTNQVEHVWLSEFIYFLLLIVISWYYMLKVNWAKKKI